MEEFAYRLLQIFRGDAVVELVFKAVDNARPSQREEWPHLRHCGCLGCPDTHKID